MVLPAAITQRRMTNESNTRSVMRRHLACGARCRVRSRRMESTTIKIATSTMTMGRVNGLAFKERSFRESLNDVCLSLGRTRQRAPDGFVEGGLGRRIFLRTKLALLAIDLQLEQLFLHYIQQKRATVTRRADCLGSFRRIEHTSARRQRGRSRPSV